DYRPEDPVRRPLRGGEQRRVVATKLVSAEDAEGDRRDREKDRSGDGDSADDAERDRAPRILDLAGHDRDAHEPVPGPEEDRSSGKYAEHSLVAEERAELCRVDHLCRATRVDREQADADREQ